MTGNSLQDLAWNTTNTLQHISDLMVTGMGDRATSVRVVFDPRNNNDNNNTKKKKGKKKNSGAGSGNRSIVVGVSLHPTHSVRLLDRGPSADDQAKSEEYRAFWGDKSELRR